MKNTQYCQKQNITANAENTFSFRLSYAIAIRKSSPAKLAKSCGLAPSNISQYLNKNTVPRMDNLKIIAEQLKVSEMWLMGYGNPSDIDKRDIPSTLSPDEIKMLRNYQSLGSKDKDIAFKILAMLAGQQTTFTTNAQIK